MEEQQREYFRVEFPYSYYPTFHSEEGQYEVRDVSECCVRFTLGDTTDFTVDDKVTAIIRFPDGDVFDCSGYIVRVTDDSAIISLEAPLPLNKIRSEHLHVIRRTVKDT